MAASSREGIPTSGKKDSSNVTDHDTGEAVSSTPSDNDPPPPYGGILGRIDQEDDEVGTGATIADDGRVNIRINEQTKGLSSLLVPALRNQLDLASAGSQPYVPPNLDRQEDRLQLPALNVVIHVVGSRGDVQPFVALGRVLKEQHGHRVRLATHPVFKQFVEENNLEFFDILGDPSELMAFMVKNPGLMPGFDTLRSGDVGHRRKEIGNMIKRCWRSCIETGDGSGIEASDSSAEVPAVSGSATGADVAAKPFVADAIIANPPSFAHIHCAEKLGIPLHMMFTMPWSPTQAFPHPLANIQSTNAKPGMTNFMSYALVDMMTWQGLGDVINRLREKSLGLEPISLTSGPGMLARLHVPYTYCWSPALIPKPRDWGDYISVSGFYFLSLGTSFTPEPDLAAFLDAGPPPVYIGFGSIVVDDPNAMTKLIFDAVKKSGQRALVSKGWGGFGADQIGVPDNVFMLGNVPHDWLFKRVACVIHHGGAGTTAAGIACGRPTVIVPFFGDQPFWGAMVARAGAGPKPIAYKELDADALAEAIQEALKPEVVTKAKEMSERISHEKGSEVGAQSFHEQLDVDKMRCQLSPTRAAAWRIRRTEIRLSPFAAAVLGNEKLLDFRDLKPYRPCEYDLDDGPWDPITGGASALVGTMGSMAMGIADLPVATLKAMKIHPDARKTKPESKKDSSTDASGPSSPQGSTESAATSNKRRSSSTDSSSLREELAMAQAVGDRMAADTAAAQADPPASSQAEATKSNSTAEQQKPFKFDQADLNNVLSTGKGAYKFASAGVKSPMDFTLSLAKGFHNAPKLYGDETVRKPEKITDFSSGLRAAGKELGYGFFDGITGLLTQPLAGAKKEGAPGFFKGVGKGIGGIVLKPGAAIWGVPGYTSKGIYREIQKQFGPSVEGYIIASRTAQGYAELGESSPEERAALVSDWKAIRHHVQKKKNVGEDKMHEIQARMKKQGMFHNGARGRQQASGADTGGSSNDPINQHASQQPSHTEDNAADPELEEAIRRSVAETSKGNAEQDASIERAIRASLASLKEAREHGADETEIQRAVQASLQEAQEGRLTEGSESESSRQVKGSDDAEPQEAVEQSRTSHEEGLSEKEAAAKEEEIVMRYVMRQSKAEEEVRQQKGGS